MAILLFSLFSGIGPCLELSKGIGKRPNFFSVLERQVIILISLSVLLRKRSFHPKENVFSSRLPFLGQVE